MGYQEGGVRVEKYGAMQSSDQEHYHICILQRWNDSLSVWMIQY